MKNFFKMLFASVLGVIIGFVIIAVFGFVIFVGVAASMDSSSAYKLQKNTVLKLNLNENTSIDEKDNSTPFDAIFNRSGESYGLNDILSAIRKAEKNDNIKGIYLNVGYAPAGFTTMEPIRNALSEFKKSGKFIIAYGETFSQPTYYVSSVADSIFMNPSGLFDFHGLATSIQFNKGIYEKWGIEMQVFKVGTYKSAVEPYIQNKMSDANREQVTSFLNEIWGTVLNKISESRNIPVAQLNQYADEFLAFADQKKTVEYKLIDGLRYSDEVENCLKNLLDLKENDKIRFAGVKNMLSVPEAGKKVAKDKIAVLYAEGTIVGDYESDFLPSGYITAKEYVKELNKLKDDKNVKAVVFRVNSPGGSAYAAEQIWHAVRELKAVKPVVVSMGSYAASGGYYISCGADKIIAEPTTLTGSIGIFGIFPSGEQLAKKMGATYDGVSTNKFADFGGGTLSIPLGFVNIGLLPARPFTNEESAMMQLYIERGYDLFISRCAEGRGKTKEAIDSIGQGRVWTGKQALNLGLVDALGDIDVAIQTAADLAKVDNYSISEYPVKKDFFMSLLEGSAESVGERIWMGIIGKEAYQQKRMLNVWKNYDFRQAIMPEFINR
ncbi:MAG: signal peptide peptidase SppA [Candidatus Azobacteroides sp.]|nr:signal peptide peptidase SppA [Candidatus Azobacteroides sp.]